MDAITQITVVIMTTISALILAARNARGSCKQMRHTIVDGDARLELLILQGELFVTYDDQEGAHETQIRLTQQNAALLAGMFADYAMSFGISGI